MAVLAARCWSSSAQGKGTQRVTLTRSPDATRRAIRTQTIAIRSAKSRDKTVVADSSVLLQRESNPAILASASLLNRASYSFPHLKFNPAERHRELLSAKTRSSKESEDGNTSVENLVDLLKAQRSVSAKTTTKSSRKQSARVNRSASQEVVNRQNTQEGNATVKIKILSSGSALQIPNPPHNVLSNSCIDQEEGIPKENEQGSTSETRRKKFLLKVYRKKSLLNMSTCSGVEIGRSVENIGESDDEGLSASVLSTTSRSSPPIARRFQVKIPKKRNPSSTSLLRKMVSRESLDYDGKPHLRKHVNVASARLINKKQPKQAIKSTVSKPTIKGSQRSACRSSYKKGKEWNFPSLTSCPSESKCLLPSMSQGSLMVNNGVCGNREDVADDDSDSVHTSEINASIRDIQSRLAQVQTPTTVMFMCKKATSMSSLNRSNMDLWPGEELSELEKTITREAPYRPEYYRHHRGVSPQTPMGSVETLAFLGEQLGPESDLDDDDYEALHGRVSGSESHVHQVVMKKNNKTVVSDVIGGDGGLKRMMSGKLESRPTTVCSWCKAGEDTSEDDAEDVLERMTLFDPEAYSSYQHNKFKKRRRRGKCSHGRNSHRS
ncbi:hypothetical protein CAPTEDRAFT_194334 [Capitella teleta]|uniref:Uncharacterized protein n=1 Tax=Capitella teleta TaxID=283909 RepID=R7TFP0_CAPTE|nr:hypothetical protein CAPTEDRAFT_194334 [Capitella teleta]|eukprot:ELT92608.1 hypothetical protein CAPTEDRAFT_194334 [Capitella teleta]